MFALAAFVQGGYICSVVYLHHRLVAIWNTSFGINPLQLFNWSEMGVERCVNLDGLTEAQIDKKLEELAKAGESAKAK